MLRRIGWRLLLTVRAYPRLMPLLRPCRHPRCPNLTPPPCPTHTLRPSHPHKSFYNSRAWLAARLLYLTSHPVCEICNRAPAMEVHHKFSIETRPDLRLDEDNFQASCKPCHSKETVRLDGGFGKGV